MFGYINVNKAELKFIEYDIYRSYYLGLRRNIKKRFGSLAKLSSSYDMTFIVLLLTGLYEPETKCETHRYLTRGMEKQEERYNEFTDYAADINMLFTIYKCLDDWHDEKKVMRLIYGNILKRKEKAYCDRYIKRIESIKACLKDFTDAEKKGGIHADDMALLFGRIMGEILAIKDDEWNDELMDLGNALGKFIYLVDAYEDVDKDIKKGTYNPFKKSVERAGFTDGLRKILNMIMDDASREFEKLPIIENVGILRNIIYSGMWIRFEKAAEKKGEILKKYQTEEEDE
ncbi:MAG: DUF5685 family protein [Lachnospiraceae bacterium]|nr:DUF5685 family protein [Lachnospiraceae bacterium]